MRTKATAEGKSHLESCYVNTISDTPSIKRKRKLVWPNDSPDHALYFAVDTRLTTHRFFTTEDGLVKYRIIEISAL